MTNHLPALLPPRFMQQPARPMTSRISLFATLFALLVFAAGCDSGASIPDVNGDYEGITTIGGDPADLEVDLDTSSDGEVEGDGSFDLDGTLYDAEVEGTTSGETVTLVFTFDMTTTTVAAREKMEAVAFKNDADAQSGDSPLYLGFTGDVEDDGDTLDGRLTILEGSVSLTLER